MVTVFFWQNGRASTSLKSAYAKWSHASALPRRLCALMSVIMKSVLCVCVCMLPAVQCDPTHMLHGHRLEMCVSAVLCGVVAASVCGVVAAEKSLGSHANK